MRRFLMVAVVAAGGLTVGLVGAEDPPKPAAEQAAAVVAAADALDADALAELAGKLGADSRAVSPEATFRAAMKVAVATKNKKALEKIKKDLEKYATTKANWVFKLTDELNAAIKLLATSRGDEAEPLPAGVTGDAVAGYRMLATSIDLAAALGDADRLAAVAGLVKGADLPAAARADLDKRLADAQAAPADESLAALRKLAGPSRGALPLMPRTVAVDFTGPTPKFPAAAGLTKVAGTPASPLAFGAITLTAEAGRTRPAKLQLANPIPGLCVVYDLVAPPNKRLTAVVFPNTRAAHTVNLGISAVPYRLTVHQLGAHPPATVQLDGDGSGFKLERAKTGQITPVKVPLI